MTGLTNDITIILPSRGDEIGFMVVLPEIEEATGSYKTVDLARYNFTFDIFQNGDEIYLGFTSLSKVKELYPNAIGVSNIAGDGFFDTFVLNNGTLERPVFAEDDYPCLIMFDAIPNNVSSIILNAEYV